MKPICWLRCKRLRNVNKDYWGFHSITWLMCDDIWWFIIDLDFWSIQLNYSLNVKYYENFSLIIENIFFQVVTLGLYTYFIAALMGKQMIPTRKEYDSPDMYVPLFAMMQVLFDFNLNSWLYFEIVLVLWINILSKNE